MSISLIARRLEMKVLAPKMALMDNPASPRKGHLLLIYRFVTSYF